MALFSEQTIITESMIDEIHNKMQKAALIYDMNHKNRIPQKDIIESGLLLLDLLDPSIEKRKLLEEGVKILPSEKLTRQEFKNAIDIIINKDVKSLETYATESIFGKERFKIEILPMSYSQTNTNNIFKIRLTASGMQKQRVLEKTGLSELISNSISLFISAFMAVPSTLLLVFVKAILVIIPIYIAKRGQNVENKENIDNICDWMTAHNPYFKYESDLDIFNSMEISIIDFYIYAKRKR